MIEFDHTVVVISASMTGPALPGKPMLDVNGRPLIVRAAERAGAAKLGKVLVAASEYRLVEAVRAAGHDALVAPASKPSPSDMAAAVLAMRDPERQFAHVLIYSCALAAIPGLDLSRCLAGLTNKAVDLATLASADGKGRLKAVAPLSAEREVAYLRDLLPMAEGEDAYAHVPVIAWRREALEKFALLRASGREALANSEIVRALDGGLRCAAVKVDSAPLTVDTASDLEKIRRLLKA